MTDTIKQARKVAQIIMKEMEKSTTPDLVLEWSMNQVFGARIKEYIPVFWTLYNFCLDNGYTSKDNYFEYGDADAGIWCEQHESRYILIIHDFVTFRDDNIFLFIMEDPMRKFDEDVTDFEYVKFISYNVYEEEVRRNSNLGDHRDIEKPSLQSVYDANYQLGYEDGRDATHNFKFENICGRESADGALWRAGKIISTLRVLDIAECSLLEGTEWE